MSFETFFLHLHWKETTTTKKAIVQLHITLVHVSDAKNNSFYFVFVISIFKVYGLYLIFMQQLHFLPTLIFKYELLMVAVLVNRVIQRIRHKLNHYMTWSSLFPEISRKTIYCSKLNELYNCHIISELILNGVWVLTLKTKKFLYQNFFHTCYILKKNLKKWKRRSTQRSWNKMI